MPKAELDNAQVVLAVAALAHAISQMRDAQAMTAQPSPRARALAVALTQAETALLWLKSA